MLETATNASVGEFGELPPIIDRTDKVLKLASFLEITPNVVSFVGSEHFNPSAMLPYHNAQHAFSTALRASAILRASSGTPQEHRLMFLACMFHDFNYSLEAETDSVNVRRAIEGFQRFAPEIAIRGVSIPPETVKHVTRLISATEQPRNNSSQYTFLQHVIQDADLTQMWHKDRNSMAERLKMEGIYTDVSIEFPPVEELNLKYTKKEHQAYLDSVHNATLE